MHGTGLTCRRHDAGNDRFKNALFETHGPQGKVMRGTTKHSAWGGGGFTYTLSLVILKDALYLPIILFSSSWANRKGSMVVSVAKVFITPSSQWYSLPDMVHTSLT